MGIQLLYCLSEGLSLSIRYFDREGCGWILMETPVAPKKQVDAYLKDLVQALRRRKSPDEAVEKFAMVAGEAAAAHLVEIWAEQARKGTPSLEQRVEWFIGWLPRYLRLILEVNTPPRRSAMYRLVRAGTVWFCDFGEGIGSEVRKRRSVVVIGDSPPQSPVVTVAPCSAHLHRDPKNPDQPKYRSSFFLRNSKYGFLGIDELEVHGDLLSTVSKARLGGQQGEISQNDLASIRRRIAGVVLGIDQKLDATHKPT